IGETVGQLGARFPDVGVAWQYTPPCVALDWWPVCPAGADAPLTTVTHWHADEWVGDNRDGYKNDKRTGFLPFLELPRQVRQPMASPPSSSTPVQAGFCRTGRGCFGSAICPRRSAAWNRSWPITRGSVSWRARWRRKISTDARL